VINPLAELTVVCPVWGTYTRFLPTLFAALDREGVARERVILVGNGEPVSYPGARSITSSTFLSVGEARNLGLVAVTTELVLFADADDTPVPGALTRLCTAALADQTLVFVSGSAVRTNGQPYPWPPPYAVRPMHRLMRIARQWGRNHLSLTTGTIIRVGTLRRLGGFPDANLAEDGMLACALVCAGPVLVLDEPTRVYNVHPEGLCQRGRSAAEWRAAFRAQRRYLAAHPALPLPWRLLAHLYLPLHWGLARWLERVAQHAV
jgi:hypothetical protein